MLIEQEDLRTPPTKYSKEEGMLYLGTYSDGSLGIQVIGVESKQPLYTMTVWLEIPHQSSDPLAMWIKDYSENEGVAESLEKAGIIELTGYEGPSGFVMVPEAIPSAKLRPHLEAYLKG
tara:strand:+ start:170 stop:526 length:357 start_codon:yes stop_codon:yes gene_type:complete